MSCINTSQKFICTDVEAINARDIVLYLSYVLNLKCIIMKTKQKNKN